MKYLLPFIFLLFFLFSSFSNESSMTFRYAFILNKNDKGRETLEASDKTINLKEGDEFKIIFQPVKNSFLYLFLTDSESAFYVLFPENSKSFEGKNYTAKKEINIPEDGWFAVDAKSGVEEFEIIVTEGRLIDFEKKIFEYSKHLEKNKDIKKINSLKEDIKDEIISLKKQYGDFTVFAEKPISIGGTTKGVGEKKSYLTEIEVKEFYAKKVKIRH